MSYLDPVRLHFAGQFQADPSTVNNTTQYYNNATFEQQYAQNGGAWNAEGSGAWRFVDCRVTRVCYADGTDTSDPAADPVVGMRIADANKRVAGKLVDLDPEQQMVSEIWTLLVRLTDGTVDYVSGPFETTAFTNLWRRATEPGHRIQQPLSAIYQSVIAPLQWGDTKKSRFLKELKKAAKDGLLSIKFNVDGYDRDNTIPTFTLGRIVGTIGPAKAGEPHHFVLGRQLGGTSRLTNFMPCVVDLEARRLTADFGNSVQSKKPAGDVKDNGDMTIGYVENGVFQSIGDASYRDAGWYPSTAGVQSFALKDAAIAALPSNPVAVRLNGQIVLQENPDGVYVRADQFVYRLSPGDTADVQLYATKYGVLQDGAPIAVNYDSSRFQVGDGDPDVATDPEKTITGFDPKKPVIAKKGRAVLKLTAHDPGNPRVYVDGQIYGVRPLPQAIVGNPPGSWVNPADFISILVFSGYKVPARPAWYPHMQPIFTQYGHLYPLMDRLIDLTSYDAVVANAGLLTFVFDLPETDPNSMPVTRDLSPAKRKAVLKFLKNPQLGTPPPAEAAEAVEAPPKALHAPEDELFLIKSGLEDRKRKE